MSAAGDGFPGRRLTQLGLGVLRLPPEQFWRASLCEIAAAFAGFTNRFRLYRREVYEAELAQDDDDDIDPLTLVGRHKRTG